jgi:hypothetical protein
VPHFPYPFVGAGWADYPTIFVEVGLEIPYSVEGFDQALQTNFKESVAKAFNVTSMRVKIVKITPPISPGLIGLSSSIAQSTLEAWTAEGLREWKMGIEGQSCTDVCSNAGLSCGYFPQQLSQAVSNALFASVGKPCSSSSWHNYDFAPFYYHYTGTCYSTTGPSTCSSANYWRLCPCSSVSAVAVSAVAGANAFFFMRVPSADEAKAQLMLAVTLEMVNMQLEQKGLNAALNFVGAARIVRQPCEAGKYRVRPGRVDVNCNSCPSSSSSPAGSVGIQACLCNAVSACVMR